MTDIPYRISHFIRFGERRFLEEFISNGTIYMNTIDYFKSIELDNERYDRNENITGYFQPHMVKIKVGERVLKDFAGPITLYNPNSDIYKASHIFCISHFPEPYVIREDKKIFDDRMLNFESLVLLKPKMFFDKMIRTLKKLQKDKKIYGFSYGLVEYVSKNSYSGDMSPFHKTDDYAHQKEFRFAISAVNRSEPLTFNLGNLKKISVGIDMLQFINKVEIDSNGNPVLIFN